MAELGKVLRVTDQAVLDALQADLIDLCAHHHAVIASVPTNLPGAPFDISLTKRADWLDSNVIHPAQKLLAALAPDKQPMFAKWPYPLSVPEIADRSRLEAQLRALLSEASDVRDLLRGQQEEDAGHSQEMRAEIFASIARLLRKHCPDVPPNRGVYVSEMRCRVGPYVDGFGMIYHKVAGTSDNLDRQIHQEIEVPS